MTIRRADKNFIDTFPELSVRFLVKDRKEKYILTDSQEMNNVLSSSFEIGFSSVDFLYDSSFDQIVGFLEVSEEIVVKIKRADDVDKQWRYFKNFANTLYDNGAMHPYYYPIFAAVVNAYRRNMRDEQGKLLPDDHFVKLGRNLQKLKQNVSDHLCMLDGIEEPREMMVAYKNHVFSNPIHLINLQAEVMTMTSDGQEAYDVVMVLTPESPLEIWDYLLYTYALSSVRFKRCENCKRFFATTGRGNPKFCERIIEGHGRSCRQVMPKLMFNSKAEKDPAVWLYNKAYKTMYSRITTKTLSKEMFHEWAKKARAKRDECTRGEISPEEYSVWLCDNGLFIDYLKNN